MTGCLWWGGLALWLHAATAATPPAQLQVEAVDPCEMPVRFGWIPREAELPAADDWRTTGGSDRLYEDACGHVWGLWFNSWQIHERGEAKRVGHLQLPYEGSLAELTRAGVEDFDVNGGVLWVYGRNGHFGRRDRAGWTRLPAPPECRKGQLERAGKTLWLSCADPRGQLLARWLDRASQWQIERRGPGLRPLLVRATPERLYAIRAGEITRIDADQLGAAQPFAVTVQPTRAAIDSRRIALASTTGLTLHQRADGSAQQHFAGTEVTGVAFDHHGALWATLRNQGVRVLVDGRWLEWRYAEGLPDDEARDVLVDSAGRLWVAGTPSAVIDADAAARRMRALTPPPPIVASVHADACDAAKAHAPSGNVASARVDGVDLVFFGNQQVCPNPWRGEFGDSVRYRRADGALLELAHNGHRGHLRCGGPCVEPSRARLAASWRVRVHRPRDDGWHTQVLQLPEPLPATSPGPHMLLTRSDEVWIADDLGGLHRHDGTRWRRTDLAAGLAPDNRATTLAEGADGAIWVGSNPTWSRERKRYSGLPLHRFQHRRWRHFAVGNTWTVWDVLPLADGALVAGNGGVLRIERDGSPADSAALGGRSVIAIATDDAGAWWALPGLGQPGLQVYAEGALRGTCTSMCNGRWRQLSTREGLLVDYWRAFAFDAQARLWLLADDGRVAIYASSALLERSE